MPANSRWDLIRGLKGQEGRQGQEGLLGFGIWKTHFHYYEDMKHELPVLDVSIFVVILHLLISYYQQRK